MKMVQMTLDEDLLREVDELASRLHTTRSGLTRQALRSALFRFKEIELEKRHRRGYRKKPVKKNEFSGWQAFQEWGEP